MYQASAGVEGEDEDVLITLFARDASSNDCGANVERRKELLGETLGAWYH